MANPQKHALTIVAKSAPGALLPRAIRILNDRLDSIRRFESRAAASAIQLGALLWHVKGETKHGAFKKWVEDNVPDRGYRACAYYMKLLLAFVEKTKLSPVGYAALVELDLEKKPESPGEKEARAALEKFIGELSLTELFIKHGLKGVGMKTELEAADPQPALTVGDDGQLWITGVEDHLHGFRSFLKPESIMRTPPEKLKAIVDEHDAQNAELHALYRKARGK